LEDLLKELRAQGFGSRALVYDLRLGFRSQVSGCRVQGTGFRVQGAGFRVRGLRIIFHSGSWVFGFRGGRVYSPGFKFKV